MTERIDAFSIDIQDATSGTLAIWKDKLNAAPKGVILNARVLRELSEAYRITKKDEFLIAATEAKDYLINNFVDHKYGGVYWSLDSNGERLDTIKLVYAQAAAINAISEYVLATNDESALRHAQNLYELVEKVFKNPDTGKYVDVLNRDWTPATEVKTTAWTKLFKASLLEPYTNLYRVWQNPRLRGSIDRLLDSLDK